MMTVQPDLPSGQVSAPPDVGGVVGVGEGVDVEGVEVDGVEVDGVLVEGVDVDGVGLIVLVPGVLGIDVIGGATVNGVLGVDVGGSPVAVEASVRSTDDPVVSVGNVVEPKVAGGKPVGLVVIAVTTLAVPSSSFASA
jgi:hypothetical protein